jgi:hypothetical protein
MTESFMIEAAPGGDGLDDSARGGGGGRVVPRKAGRKRNVSMGSSSAITKSGRVVDGDPPAPAASEGLGTSPSPPRCAPGTPPSAPARSP